MTIFDAFAFVFDGKENVGHGLIEHSDVFNMDGWTHGRQLQVAIHFALIVDRGASECVPMQQFVIARESDNGKLTYLIDNRPSSFDEVMEKLRCNAVSFDLKRILVTDCGNESIAAMQPKAHGDTDGLLEYLVDIIGTAAHKGCLERMRAARANYAGVKSKEEKIAAIQQVIHCHCSEYFLQQRNM